MAPSPYRGRFAPSPTGPLHLGSLLAALGSWLLARQAGGEWLVRIEDIDPPRTVAGAAETQLRSLHAFGLHPDGPVVRQSERHALYQQALDTLLQRGLAFACGCSRSDLATVGGLHHHCVEHPPRARQAARLRVRPGCRIEFADGLQGLVGQDVHAEVGDFVLRRSDGHWAYQLAVVVDDAEQGITDVVRGADLLDSTPRQILLHAALGLPPPRYLHLPLLLDAAGRKLSKSESARALDDTDPAPALHRAWHCLGQPSGRLPARAAPEQMLRWMLQHFRPDLIPRRLPV
ncbi:MAG: tRNA glutamyl-Q(34) synthetase GluQRS [Pseudomonas sp.]